MKSTISTIIVILASLLLYINPVNAQSSPPILFWGDGCPHCEKVKDEIKEKKLDRNILIDYREIYYNEDNANLFDQKIKECGISPYNAGVPLIYINGSCWIGTDEIIYSLEKEIEENGATYTIDDSNKQFEIEKVAEQPPNNNESSIGVYFLVVIVVLIIGISIYLLWIEKRK